MRGRGLFCRKVPSLALPPLKTMGWGDAGGRGRFSERSASPPRPLSPEERLAFEEVASSERVPPESWACFFCFGAVVAAALSAAVTTTYSHRKRAQLAWACKSAGKLKPIPSHSSGAGVWGRGASLREAASPPEICPLPFLSCLCYNKNRINLHVKEEFLVTRPP